jgi:hypothetical protein
MNGPKVAIAALVKFGYMLEQLSIWWYRTSGDNPSSAANQQERLVDEIRILRDYTPNADSKFVGEDIVPSAWRHAGTKVKEAFVRSM